MDYFALIVFVLCLLIFDTETWLQRLLLLVLAVYGRFGALVLLES